MFSIGFVTTFIVISNSHALTLHILTLCNIPGYELVISALL